MINNASKIFISYARADDEPFVKQLYQDLTERGFDIWWNRKAIDSWDLTFLQEIRDSIEESDRLHFLESEGDEYKYGKNAKYNKI